jgi:hypothetical protein
MYFIDSLIAKFYCNEECLHNFTQSQIYIDLFIVIISLMISLRTINLHMTYYSNPFFQDKIIGNLYSFSDSIYGTFLFYM